MAAGPFHVEVILAAVYALMLMLIAAALERLAKRSYRRADQYQTGGFRFHRDRDAWECPKGIALIRAGVDDDQRTIRYRAPAHSCNNCEIKARCTHSDGGREIVVHIDPWVASASLRLQRGMSLVLLSVAAFILSVELFRQAARADQYLLGAVLAVVVLRFTKLGARVRHSPEPKV